MPAVQYVGKKFYRMVLLRITFSYRICKMYDLLCYSSKPGREGIDIMFPAQFSDFLINNADIAFENIPCEKYV